MVMLKREVNLPGIGIDLSKPAEFLDPRISPDSSNVEVDRFTVRKRFGTASLGASLSEQVMGISYMRRGTDVFVIRTGLDKVQKLDQSTDTWSDIHNTILTGTVADRFDFANPTLSGQKIFVYTNGVDAIRKWTGTGNDANLGGSPPLCKYLLSYGGYLLLVHITDGGTTYTTRVQWCDTGDIENWSTGNAGTLELLEDEGDTTGVDVFGDFVTVHKENSIYVGYLVSSSAVFRFDRKNTGVGTVSNESIQNLPNGAQIFLARDGLHLFNGITAPLIPSPIMDEIRESMNPEYMYRSISSIVRERDEYWVGIPIGGQTMPETVYKYNYQTGYVYKDTRENMTALGLFERVNTPTWDSRSNTWDSDTTRWNDVVYLNNNLTVMIGDSSGNTVMRSPIYSDNGTAISSYWESKDFTISDLIQGADAGRIVRWTKLNLWAAGNTVQADYSIDGGYNWIPIATFSLDSQYPPDFEPLVGYFDATSTKLRIRFRNEVAGESFTVKRFYFEATPGALSD